MFHQTNIVLIGNSLVEQSKSIAHLNKRVINIDSFNDEDLIGENYKNSNQFGLVNDEVLIILKNLKLNKNETLIIVSSDYERDKDYYSLLKSYGKIVGNSQETILKIKDYENLSEKLKKNNIKFPTKISPKINSSQNFLIKNKFSSGGFGIKRYHKKYIIDHEKEYCQEFIEGKVFSILFLANNNKEYKIIGINEIFSKKTIFTEFCFSGAINNILLNEAQNKYLNSIIKFFIDEYELVGINGIDFIISDEIYFLEINPRITQTSFLYENIFKEGFVAAHIESDINNIFSLVDDFNNPYSCFENLFSNSSSSINYDLKKFSFVSNIPKMNSHIDVGQPICTISVNSDNEKKAKNLLSDNILLIKNKLKNVEII
ncbi:ATP-grasp domain-containing protein [Gammaproteobacteria bacterium]|nr:ATP-grasp domain-containing protein [Gammaproteobacteria bacterium]